MQNLKDMDLLVGQVETITATDFRMDPGDVFMQVAMGKKFIITKNGTPIAEIHRPKPPPVLLGAEVRRLGLADGPY